MEMIKQDAYVWRESVYKNDFKCPECGTRLADSNGSPDGEVLFSPTENLLVCPNCNLIVCKIKEVEVAVKMEGLQGHWGDFTDEPLFDEKEEYKETKKNDKDS